MDAFLKDLNPQQREAVQHGSSPLLIVAGAGTGKTTTLAHRVAWLLLQGIDPARILLLTFTRRSAADMQRRVEGLLRKVAEETNGGEDSAEAAETPLPLAKLDSRRIWGGTFHSVGTRLLRKHADLIGLSRDFTVLDRGDAEDLMHVVRGELNLVKKNSRFPHKGTCLDIYSRCINSRKKLDTILAEVFPWCVEFEEELRELFRVYTDRKEQVHTLDYDDLLLFWDELMDQPQSGDIIRKMFDAILVDEFQDTNLLQSSILSHLAPTGEGLTAVGDDAQSIYSFRAATVRNILDFPGQYPGSTVIPLEQNYRSTQPILDATNVIIAGAAERHEKYLWSTRKEGERPQVVLCLDEDEQTDFLVEQILAHRETGTSLSEQAVLFRASHHSLALELELTRRNIPFHKYGGLKFIEAAHVKDLLAFLRLAENSADIVAGQRVLTLLPGIGQKKAEQLLASLSAKGGRFEAWRSFSPPEATRLHWGIFLPLMQHLQGETTATRGTGMSLGGQIQAIRKFYAPLLESRYDNSRARLKDLEQLEVISSRFENRQTFLTEMALDPPASTQDLAGPPVLDEEYLVLSTIHSAKGLEWDSVYVIHASDGNIPSDMATGSAEEIEEERRLFYVALTRARRWLYVCVPQRYYSTGRYRGDRHSYAQPSRFLPDENQPVFSTRPAFIHSEDSPASEPQAPVLTTEEIRQRVKNRW